MEPSILVKCKCGACGTVFVASAPSLDLRAACRELEERYAAHLSLRHPDLSLPPEGEAGSRA